MRNSVVANFAPTATDGKMYQVDYYNLDVIISVGYRVKSQRGVQFRIWATNMLKEYIKKGFSEEMIEMFDNEVNFDALRFINFLKANEMQFEKAGGYWENQNYYMVKYNKEYVCFILINGIETEEKFRPFTVWSDSLWLESSLLSDSFKKIAWDNVDICEHCGSCRGGKSKNIFGKEFNNVCKTTFRFINPNKSTFECIEKLIELRKIDIETRQAP